MQLRLAARQDIPELCNLFDEFMTEYYKETGSELSFSPSDDLKTSQAYLLQEILESANQNILVAQNDTKLVGFLYFFTTPRVHRGCKVVIIYSFFVVPEFQHQGLGSSMLAWLKDWCLQQNIHIIEVNTSLDLPKAQKFYEKNGGQETDKLYEFDF